MATPRAPDPPLVDEKTIFEDFDARDVFEKVKDNAAAQDRRNFVVRFNAAKAEIAFDLSGEQMEALLVEDRNTSTGSMVRWINIWNSSTQSGALNAIGAEYGFSKRLQGLMGISKAEVEAAQKLRQSKSAQVKQAYTPARPQDVELGIEMNGRAAKTNAKLEQLAALEVDDDMALYLLVKDTVNFSSVDQTPNALCIGAHWLHKRPKADTKGEPEAMVQNLMPPMHWMWLVLCSDNTVISIHETPYFSTQTEEDQKMELRNMRVNTLQVLLQISEHGFNMYEHQPLSQSSIREPMKKALERESGPREHVKLRRQDTSLSTDTMGYGNVEVEGTSNLFYYLFEDYVAAEPFKVSGQILKIMTNKILGKSKPKVKHKLNEIIPTLHTLSKELRDLKHLFENYKNLISKITKICKPESRHSRVLASNVIRRNTMAADNIPEDGETLPLDAPHKVELAKTAINRFDRLGDRLELLMLSTIDGYLEEIKALLDTYFNITQQKDSQATARLTRSATLLAKLSVFFLPIGFLTSYFSVQIPELSDYYTARDYWYSFAVIATISFLGIFFFSKLLVLVSDIFDSLSDNFVRITRKMLGLPVQDEEEDED